MSETLADRLRRTGEGLLERWCDWRNRLVANPKFQRISADRPLVRRIAAANAASIFDLCAGFVYSQILRAGVRLGLSETLAEGPLTLAEIGRRLALDPEPASRLVDASVAIGLLERRAGGRYGLSLKGAAMRGTPGLAAMIEHHALVYADLADPVRLLRAGSMGSGLADFWSYADGDGRDPARAAAYSRLMAATQGFVRDDILDAYAFGRHRRVLDVGGGDGSFLEGLAERHPGLDLHLFDLPPVAALAASRFAARAGPRPTAHAGDFRTDPLPADVDLVTFVRILHDHGEPTVATLLARAHAALSPGGRVLIAEPMAGPAGDARVGDAYFGFYLMAMGKGRARSAEAIGALARQAGFVNPRLLRTRRPLLVSLLVADKM